MHVCETEVLNFLILCTLTFIPPCHYTATSSDIGGLHCSQFIYFARIVSGLTHLVPILRFCPGYL